MWNLLLITALRCSSVKIINDLRTVNGRLKVGQSVLHIRAAKRKDFHFGRDDGMADERKKAR